ncbi:MAG: phospholipase D-like domain-containing protein [Bacteroidota bacterium]|nr:phospholipase D-like domain-containing protein [Bacteroidota bacterium]
MKKLLLSLLLVLSGIVYSQQLVTIDSLRYNDVNGVPIDTGKVFKIVGIISASNQLGASGPGAIQDETAGVFVYGNTFAGPVQVGDSVTLTGTLVNYNGLTQFDFRRPGGSVTKHSSGSILIPKLVTIAQIKSQQWNGYEEFEGQLVKIANVNILGTGNFAANTNYNIQDSTGTLTSGLRIYTSVTSIVGTPIPTGKIDLIGVLGQYKSAAPYNSGYQLIPRFIQDIVTGAEPVVLSPVLAADIDTNKFSVYFNTIRNGNSKVKYGLTTNLELDSVVVNADTTSHKVTISGLQKGTLYYFKAFSKNSAGESSGQLEKVTTANNDTTVGKINVYFNFPVDTTVAISNNKANGNTQFETKLLDRISRAKSSIDLALYSFFGMENIANALILAKNRGVKVRVVYDYRSGSVPQNSMQLLLNAGILMSRRPNANGLMHNKFIIFDERDSINTNDWVWTGSWNVTSSELTWKNSVIEINDHALAQAYTTEFEEMWGSNTDTPNSSNAKFGSAKTDNTPHYFNIGGRDIRLYFSPSDNTESKIQESISTANNSIYFCSYTFTSSNVQTTIAARHSAGVNDIRGVIDQVNMTGSQWGNLQTYSEMLQNPSPTLHHKYGIIDASYPSSSPIVIAGSHNWTRSANEDNDENTLIIRDLSIANQYLQEFKSRYNEAGGTGVFVVPTGVSDPKINEFNYSLHQNYPNPFNPTTTIRFEVPYAQNVELAVYDILGQKIKTLFSGMAKQGITVVDFNGKDFSSGVYIYQIKAGNKFYSKKMLMIK